MGYIYSLVPMVLFIIIYKNIDTWEKRGWPSLVTILLVFGAFTGFYFWGWCIIVLITLLGINPDNIPLWAYCFIVPFMGASFGLFGKAGVFILAGQSEKIMIKDSGQC